MMTRRKSLACMLTVSLGDALRSGERAEAQPTAERSRTLVAYFTRSGNTKLIAGKVRCEPACNFDPCSGVIGAQF